MTLQPQGTNLKKAVQWISEEKKAGSNQTRQQLIDAACLKFNLTPMEAEYLLRSYKELVK
jgi:hypothetical protein